MALFRFTYTSTASTPFREADLLHLRLTSEDHNDRHGVTGLLLYGDLRFAQLVEGPENGLAHIVDRIVRDPRHDNIEVLYQGPVAKRQFGGWALRARWISPGVSPDIFMGDVKAAVARVPDADVAADFIRFASSVG